MKDNANMKKVTIVLHPGYDIEARLADDIKISDEQEKEMAQAAGVEVGSIHSLDESIAEVISNLENLSYMAKYST